MPSGTPTTRPIATASTPISSEIRVPYMSRVAMSRPSWSVPSQCEPDGPWIATDRSCAFGSYGEISGAAKASTRNVTIIPSPTSAGGWWRKRCQALISVPDPRVDDDVEDVHEHVQKDEQCGV